MLAIIPARGGSKGLPGKNIRPLHGKPLIAHTIEAALASKHITEVIVSTDDDAIYQAGIEWGASPSFLRPSELAQDDSMAVDTYIYTIDRLNRETDSNHEAFVVLQPTSPLRKPEDIDGAVELYQSRTVDSVISFTEEHHPISWHMYVEQDGRFNNIFPESLKNRQDNRVSYYPNGAIYVFDFNLIKQRKYYTENSLAYLMPRERSVDIDTLADFEYAEYLMGKHQ